MIWRGIIVVIGIALSACTTTTREPDRIANDHWEMRGKFSASSSNDSHSGSWRWRQTGENNTLNLYGPLGIGATEIASDGDVAIIRRGNQHYTVDANNTDALNINTPLPLPALRYWLMGKAAPNTLYPIIDTTQQGSQLSALTQAGWSLMFSRFETIGGQTLPGRITATDGDVRLKLLIKHWNLTPEND